MIPERQRKRSAVPEPQENVSISDYLMILLDEWRTLALPLLLVIAGAVAYLLLAVPSYRARGVIQVSSDDPTGAGRLLELTGMGRPCPVETEVEILRSHRIVAKACRELGLQLGCEIPRLTFDLGVSLGGESPLAEKLHRLRRSLKEVRVEDRIESSTEAVFSATEGGDLSIDFLDGSKPALAESGENFSARGISLSVEPAIELRSGERLEVSILPDDMLVASMLEKLHVESIGGRKETNLVRVSAVHADRTVARDFVNALMDSYMGFALEWRTLRADRSASFIEKQLDAIRQNLEGAEQELQDFLEQSGAIALDEQAKELIRGGVQLDLELRKVRIQEDLLSSVTADIRRANRRGGPVSLTGDFLFEDQLLAEAIGALNELEIKREMLLAEVTETHPEVVRLHEEIRRVRDQVLEYVSSSRDRIREKRKQTAEALDGIQQKLAGFPDNQRRMAGIRRKLDVSQELYGFLMTKLEEARILKASTTTDKRVIDRATTPFRRSSPRMMLTLAFAGFLGLLLGVGAVFLRRAADPRIRDEEEAKELSELPLYGVIPDLKDLGSPGSVDRVWDSPKGPAAESFRTLRTNVEFAQVGETRLQVLQVTSSEASEGKSTVLSNLAVALAKAGHSVLVVDLDLRRPVQHRIWSLPRTPGISDHLVGRARIALRRSDQWEISAVTAGNEPPESQRLLASDRLAELIAGWREEYDYVLLDTPPLLVADSLVISRLSDMMLFVVRPRTSRRAALRLAQQTHSRMEVVKGLVINGVTTRRGGYYHYYRGSYYGSRTTDTQES
jgi:capsular exopolysaccharide synthesis family protein